MKFHIDNVVKYDGSDLILLVGCPGSRWSSVYLDLCKNPAVNTSEWRPQNTWDMPIKDVNNEMTVIGSHRGVYWGPGNDYGQNFDRLFTMLKPEILAEFMEPFENWDGIKVIKSHWFSYHLEYLHALFPKARIVSCYANDVDCFYWWHKCGGWGMLFPKYTWYDNDSRILEKISQENANILKFNRDRNVLFNILNLKEFYTRLGIPHEPQENTELKCEVAIYDGTHLPNFYHITR